MDERIIRYLDAHIALDGVQEATDVVDGVVELPSVVFKLVVPLLPKEQDLC